MFWNIRKAFILVHFTNSYLTYLLLFWCIRYTYIPQLTMKYHPNYPQGPLISNNIASFLLDLVELLNIFHVQCNQTWWVRWKHLTCSSRCSQWYRLYIPVFTLHLSIVVKKTFYCNDHIITEFGITDTTPLLHMLYYINWLTHDFWTRTGGWEFDCSHGAGTSSPSHWQQVEEQAPKPVGWTMCFLLKTFVPVQKLCLYIYIYIYICEFLMSSVIGRIYNGNVIQYWRSCTPSGSIELYFWGVHGSWAECHLFFLVYQLCLALW